MIKQLSNYPRLNIPPHLHHVDESKKVELTIAHTTLRNMYFLVILPTKKADLFWLDRYDSIPKECWKLNWRDDSTVTTRLLLHNFTNYNLIEIEALKIKLDKIFETL